MVSQLISVCGRAETGLSRPFLCQAEDGNSYFVKGDNVAPEQLVIEYVISRLAEESGLPVAPVQVVNIPKPLAAFAVVERAEEFQPGLAFGSRRIQFSEEIRSSHVRSIHEETRMRVLCFDWWTRNPDRCLDRVGGDPNLLWDPVLQSVFLIDHDRCLAEDFDPAEFKKQHAFRDSRPFLEKPFFEKWRTKFESAIYGLKKIWDEIPPEWLSDPTGVERVSLTRQEMESRLMKPEFPIDGILPN